MTLTDTTKPSRGVLLVDVGTPAALTKESVESYLQAFLGDPFVIRGPRWLREILFRRIIIPLRASKSLEKYRRIWTEAGSPLRTEAQVVSEKLEFNLNDGADVTQFLVRYAFHYGGPDIEEVLADFRKQGIQDLLIVPLYPQWALSTRGGLEDRLRRSKVYHSIEEGGFGFANVKLTSIFYDHPGFIEAQASQLKKHLPSGSQSDVGVVFSFHGLPESHITAVVPSCKKCLKREGECHPNPRNKPYCYRAQCFETARQISVTTGLFNWDVAFQSRLGPTKWLAPSLQDVADQLLNQGVKTMVVQCPSFVFDCLETLEEVGLELREHFIKGGGKEFILVPALNHSEPWLSQLTAMVKEAFVKGE